jgi:hypothetical protein
MVSLVGVGQFSTGSILQSQFNLISDLIKGGGLWLEWLYKRGWPLIGMTLQKGEWLYMIRLKNYWRENLFVNGLGFRHFGWGFSVTDKCRKRQRDLNGYTKVIGNIFINIYIKLYKIQYQ